MQVLRVYPVAPGRWSGWSAIEPAGAEGWSVLDDDPHDSDASYIYLPKLAEPSGRASFRFASAMGIVPESITVYGVARKEGGAVKKYQIGFARGDSAATGFGAAFTLVADYSTCQRDFAVSPITGLAWTAAEMTQLELCVQSVPDIITNCYVTMLHADIYFVKPRHLDYGGDRKGAVLK